MILHTGMRTDIPAFYAPWFVNRLRAGTVSVRNPFDPAQVTVYRLDPAVVDLIGFCTKNPAPMLPYMELLAPYGQFWYVTITPYGRDVEPHVPPWRETVRVFRRLSEIVGTRRIGWRYDPIFIDARYTMDFHRRMFAEMADALAGATGMVVVSYHTVCEDPAELSRRACGDAGTAAGTRRRRHRNGARARHDGLSVRRGPGACCARRGLRRLHDAAHL